jgi:hypothetical protein
MANVKTVVELEFKPTLEEIQREIDGTIQKISELKRELLGAESSPGILSEDYDKVVVFDMATNTELAVITGGDTPITTASDDIVVKLRPKDADCDVIVTMKPMCD